MRIRIGLLFLILCLLLSSQPALPARAETVHESLESSAKQACCTWHVLITASGTSVNNHIRASVNGSLVLDRDWGWDDSWGYNVFITQPTAPSVGVGLRDHVVDSQYNAACGGPTPPYTFMECVEDFGDMDYNDLVYQIAVLLVDTTPPTTTHVLAGTNGTSGWYTSNVVVTLNATDSGGGTVSSTTLDGSAYAAARTMSTEGTTAHTYFSVDSFSNTEATKSFSLKIDKTAPTAAISSPAANTWFAATSFNVSGTASDATSGMSTVELQMDSGVWQAAVVSGGNWTSVVNASLLSDGAHVISARATDMAGNTNTVTRSINIDKTAPSLSLSASCPAPGENGWCKAPVNVLITAGDAGIGLSSVWYSVNGDEKIVGESRIEFGVAKPGGSGVSARATDKANNTSQTQSAEFKIDGQPPSIEFRGATSSALVFRISDADSGVQSWTLQVFNAQGQSVFYKEGTGEFSGEMAWSPNSAGSHIGGKLFSLMAQSNAFKINIFAKDKAGHQSSLPQAAFSLNAIATALPTPTVTATRAAVIAPTFTSRPTNVQSTSQPTPTPTSTAVAIAVVIPAQPLPVQPEIPIRQITLFGYTVRRDENGKQYDVANVAVDVFCSVTGERLRSFSNEDGKFVLVLPTDHICIVRADTPDGMKLISANNRVWQGISPDPITFVFEMPLPVSLLIPLLLLILLLALLVLLVVTALDRRPLAYAALAKEVELIMGRRLKESSLRLDA